MRYPADPPTVEEIVAVMRHTSDDRHGSRLRAMIAMLWRAGLRIQEALALAEYDLDHRRGSLLVRSGKGGRRREALASERPDGSPHMIEPRPRREPTRCRPRRSHRRGAEVSVRRV
jgi:integrase